MPSCISSAVSPISRRMGWTQENSTRLTVIPTARLTRMDTPTTCTTFLCSFAPRYWEHRTDVPRLMTSKTRKVSMIIWLTTPTAATLLSEWLLSMMVSTAPSIMMRSVSIKMGAASLASRFFRLSCCIIVRVCALYFKNRAKIRKG